MVYCVLHRLVWVVALGPQDAMNRTSFDNVYGMPLNPLEAPSDVVVGTLHNYALHVDGRASWTPFVRWALLLNCNVFLAMTIGALDKSGRHSSKHLQFHGVRFLRRCAVIEAASDMGREIKIWRKKRHGEVAGEGRRGARFCSSILGGSLRCDAPATTKATEAPPQREPTYNEMR